MIMQAISTKPKLAFIGLDGTLADANDANTLTALLSETAQVWTKVAPKFYTTL